MYLIFLKYHMGLDPDPSRTWVARSDHSATLTRSAGSPRGPSLHRLPLSFGLSFFLTDFLRPARIYPWVLLIRLTFWGVGFFLGPKMNFLIDVFHFFFKYIWVIVGNLDSIPAPPALDARALTTRPPWLALLGPLGDPCIACPPLLDLVFFIPNFLGLLELTRAYSPKG